MDEAIQEIASIHGIALTKNDPVMVLHTLNERLINDSKDAQNKLLDNFRSQMEVISDKWATEAKNHSDRILNSSIVSSKAEVARIMEEQSSVIIEQWKNELSTGFSQVHETMQSSRQAAILNIIASIITSLSAVVVLYIFINLG
ncbi:MAG: hypothetical protein H0X02_01215 [Nitrosomonas sp.]|nr:hypothetical protein [Nitrosomonas sp.]